jgi:hypothetical protein
LGLHHSIVARHVSEHPPLRARDAKGLHNLVIGTASHARHIVDMEGNAQAQQGGLFVAIHYR